MVKKVKNFTKSCVYGLSCKNILYYVGSTLNFERRKLAHKSNTTNINNMVKYNYKIYAFIRENGGFDEWQMEKIESYPNCKTIRELREHERFHYDENNQPILNTFSPTTTYEEIRKRQDLFHKEYRLRNMEKMNKCHDCPCGGRYTYEQVSTHRKSKRHQKYLESLPPIVQQP